MKTRVKEKKFKYKIYNFIMRVSKSWYVDIAIGIGAAAFVFYYIYRKLEN